MTTKKEKPQSPSGLSFESRVVDFKNPINHLSRLFRGNAVAIKEALTASSLFLYTINHNPRSRDDYDSLEIFFVKNDNNDDTRKLDLSPNFMNGMEWVLRERTDNSNWQECARGPLETLIIAKTGLNLAGTENGEIVSFHINPSGEIQKT